MAKIKLINKNRILPSKYPLVIGYFSCVHVMHAQLLSKYHHFNILTFNDFHSKNKNAIYSFNQRLTNIEKYKPMNIYVLDLNKHNMKAIDFIDKVLKLINPSEIVVGADFKFGSDHKNVDFLKRFYNVDVIRYNKQISTTKIVESLRSANVAKANDFLSEPYYYESKWIKGRGFGKRLGYKTINLRVDDNIVLPDGVYITTIELGMKKYKSISFLGTSKTTGSTNRTLETHVLYKNIPPRMLYSSLVRNNIKLSFLDFVRNNKKFESADQLIVQIAKDKENAIKYFKENI